MFECCGWGGGIRPPGRGMLPAFPFESQPNQKPGFASHLKVTTKSWLERVDIFQTFQTNISDATYEELRRILEKQNGHAYTLEDAREIGNGLIDFFNVLVEFSNGR